MPIISLVGCNAVGKSTAARRYAARYPALVAVSADTQLVLQGGGERREREWKGTVAEKRALVEAYQARPVVALVESARTTHLGFLRPRSEVIIVTCAWRLYEIHMRARCEKKGKRFREDYWTEWKLGYEAGRRYLNYAAKSLKAHHVAHFEVTDQAADWPAIDAHFGAVYRRLSNALVRRG